MPKFDFFSAYVPAPQDGELLRQTVGSIRRELQTHGWSSDFASFLLPGTREYLDASKMLAASFSDCSAMVVVGIGGSNLWTVAISEALFGKPEYAETGKRLFFLDTVDSRKTKRILSAAERIAVSGGKIALVSISKSGSTAETASLTETAWDFLSRRAGLSSERSVAITEPGSKLEDYARSKGWQTLPMRPKVWGRYSVFSNVGLFPLAFLGVDVEALVSGASAGLAASFLERPEENPAFLSARFLFEGAGLGRNVADHFFFSDAFESVGKWYRQLLWESVGKEFSTDGTLVRTGITPTTSIGSTDLHSVGQLYLGWPRDKSFTFVRTTVFEPVEIPSSPSLDAIVPNLSGKPLSAVMDAICQGTLSAYRAKGIPFAEWELREDSAYDLGYFLQVKMGEVAFLGAFFRVNPFDQPNVEDYKSGTRAALAAK